jgi:hypothetical protein
MEASISRNGNYEIETNQVPNLTQEGIAPQHLDGTGTELSSKRGMGVLGGSARGRKDRFANFSSVLTFCVDVWLCIISDRSLAPVSMGCFT